MYVRKGGFFQLPTVADRHPPPLLSHFPRFPGLSCDPPTPCSVGETTHGFPPGKKFLKSFLWVWNANACMHLLNKEQRVGGNDDFFSTYIIFPLQTWSSELIKRLCAGNQSQPQSKGIQSFLIQSFFTLDWNKTIPTTYNRQFLKLPFNTQLGDVKFSSRLKISWSTKLPYCSQLID